MNREFLPSLSALLAFESTGRHSSITAAASELNLTQSAVSRQIRQLEDLIGVSLFRRSHQRVHLTDAGRCYLKDVAEVLEHLGTATQRAAAPSDVSTNLRLTVLPAAMTRWLVPRLSDFLTRNPAVTVHLSNRSLALNFAAEAPDCAIHCGASFWPGAVAYPLMDELLIPVCSPKFLREHRIQTAADFATLTLLHETGRQSAWSEWFRESHVKDYREPHGLCFEQDTMLSQAAVAGLGVALLPTLLVEEELACGTLVQPLDDVVLRGRSYSLLVPSSKIGSPLIQRFSEWIVQQAERVRLPNMPAVRTNKALAGLPSKPHTRVLRSSPLRHRSLPIPAARTSGRREGALPLR